MHLQPPAVGATQFGIASWYGDQEQGNLTANGEVFDKNQMTAAHLTLPFGTRVEVHDLDNDRSVEVRINDRGPHVRRRIIDLSYAAARKLDMIGPGLAKVQITVLGYEEPADASQTYTVQVGSFGDPEHARSFSAELRLRYPEVTISDDGEWHRVQVGRFKRRSEAEGVVRQLQSLGFSPLVVVLR